MNKMFAVDCCSNRIKMLLAANEPKSTVVLKRYRLLLAIFI